MKINRIIAGFLLLCGLAACEDNREEFMEPYSTVVYITNSGESEVALYKTGESALYKLGIYKAGAFNGNGASAEVKVMDAANLQLYNAENGTAYELLPADCYTMGNSRVDFVSGENNRYVDITFKTETIDLLPAGTEYVLPVVLTSSSPVNEDKTVAMLKPVVLEASVKLGIGGESEMTLPSGGENIAETEEVTVSVDFENKWDIALTITNEDELVDAYNASKGTAYIPFPSGSYTLEPSAPVLKAGQQSMIVKYRIDKSKLELGNKYLLPVKLSGVSKFEVDGELSVHYFIVEYVDPIIAQSNWEVCDYRDYMDGDGDGPGALIDDNPDTYWHANWDIGSPLPSWITVKLTDDTKTATISQVELYARQNNATGPKTVEIWTSMDGEEFTLFGTLAFQAVKSVQKVVGARPVQARYVKMNITEKNNDSVAMGEMYVRGVVE